MLFIISATLLGHLLLFLKIFCIAVVACKLFCKLTTGKCKCMTCLNGKTVLVTGGSAGIGFETAVFLASRGCKLIIASRTVGQKHKDEIIRRTGNKNIKVKQLDLCSLDSVRKLAKDINETEDRLDILINNAGSGVASNLHTNDGLHNAMQTNHFGPFLLTHLLLDLIKKSAPSRIIFVSSLTAFTSRLTKSTLNHPEGHSLKPFKVISLYGNSKLCNVITANCLAEKLLPYNVTVNSVHPGIIDTEMFSNIIITDKYKTLLRIVAKAGLKVIAKSPEEGAETIVHLALSRNLENVTGKHFWDCKQFFMPPRALDEKLCREIWDESEKLVGLKETEKI